MAGKMGWTFRDNTGEMSRVEIYTEDMTAGNIAAMLASADPDTVGGLAESIAHLSLCQLAKYDVTALQFVYSGAVPPSLYAQRELALLVTYTDTVNGKTGRVSIPGPDWTNLGQTGSDNVNPTAPLWVAFVTAFEAAAHSADGNPVEIVGGRLVGRNR